MEKMHTISKKISKTPLPLLALYVAIGFFAVASVVIMYSDNSSCDVAHHHTVGGKQTVCPVMVMSIDKDVYTEYKGTKVYFCCPVCKPEFEKNPEKYIGKLPQFKDVEKDKIWEALGSEKYISANFHSLLNRKSMV